MRQWAEAQGIIPGCQFGFRGVHGTTCTIFVLNTLIEQSKWKQKKPLSGFIDFRKAFDLVDLELLGRKLCMEVRDKYKSTDNLIEYAQAQELGGQGPPQCRSLYIYTYASCTWRLQIISMGQMSFVKTTSSIGCVGRESNASVYFNAGEPTRPCTSGLDCFGAVILC